MSYVEKNLMTGETIVYQTKRNWIIFFWPAVLVIASLIAVIMSIFVLAVIFLLAALVIGFSPLINYLSSEFAITNKRVIVKQGFIRRTSLEVLLSKVESIQVEQSIGGRILGYGSIEVRGTGGSRDWFHLINEPLELRKHAQEQIEQIQK